MLIYPDGSSSNQDADRAGPSGQYANPNYNYGQDYNYGYNQPMYPKNYMQQAYAPYMYPAPVQMPAAPIPVAPAPVQAPAAQRGDEREAEFRAAITRLDMNDVPAPPALLVGTELERFELEMRNPFDTARMRSIAFPAMTVAGKLLSRNMALGYLVPSIDATDQADVVAACKALEVTSFGRCIRKNWSTTQHLPIMCCELLAPFLPNEKFLAQDNARMTL